LAGVEAGAKIFVPGGDEPFGSLAHTVTADQKRRGIVCAKNRTVEDFLNIDISLLPFSTSESYHRTYSCCKARHDSYGTAFD
jgi:hypothetical protein